MGCKKSVHSGDKDPVHLGAWVPTLSSASVVLLSDPRSPPLCTGSKHTPPPRRL